MYKLAKKIITTKFFGSIRMLRFGKAKVAKKEFYGARKTKFWDVGIHNIVVSILIETKNNSKYMIGYLDEVIRPLVLILPKMSGYVKTFKDKGIYNISISILLSIIC